MSDPMRNKLADFESHAVFQSEIPVDDKEGHEPRLGWFSDREEGLQ